ncbi:conserved Plasmodium protein, unknown function [Plasmodium gallinaceum]|uniref:EF-hand domain-containing protein n=1 Tax=Plasmodium gallinaceum TaxID=5849 RepID=A0A1J1GM56_PLAGA|nr:conserved Plasmodium protein, unknown function [Plasmodium gallinaceum]CRG93317.1 conserved Plasmodium protein, unknown function [Plasmodium gallinaceum]
MDLLYINKIPELNYENEVTKKIVLKIIHKLDKQQKEESRNTNFYNRSKIINFFSEAELLFKYHDIEKKGELDIKLFPKMARQLKQIYDIRDIKRFEKEMKTKKLSKMNLPMFLTLLKRKLFQTIDDDETFKKYFDVLDMNKNKKINLDQLKMYLGLVGDKISHEEINSFISYYVENNKKLIQNDLTLDDKNLPTEIGLTVYKDILTYFKNF